jgi:rubredoxin
MKKYLCVVCGSSYDEALGLPEDDIAPGTRWADLPNDWTCSHCQSPRSSFWLDETPKGVEAVIAALDAFQAESDGNDDRRLAVLLRDLSEEPDRAKAIGSLFAVMERFPEAELGTPGPLVHELEAMGGYEGHLRASLKRKPTVLTVWMVNRVLNLDIGFVERRAWLSELRGVVARADAPQAAREDAFSFLRFQADRECSG